MSPVPKSLCVRMKSLRSQKDDKIALGTIHKGLVLVDCSTMQLKYFNENNGLRNNTVLSVSFDTTGNLWAGLDSGIDYVCLSSPFTNLYSYPYSYGTGYTAAVEGGYLYLGTNRGCITLLIRYR